MNATPVSKDEIRILVKDFGYAETSARTGIKEPTLRQWAKRGKWNTPFVHSQVVTTVTQRPADAHAAALSERKQQSRALLSEYQVRAATEAAAHEKPLSITRNVKDLADIHSKVWPEDQTKEANFSLNVLNLNMFSDDSTPELDA